MTVDTRLMTADELLAMPDDGYQYELVRGELRKMSPGNPIPSSIAIRIAAHLSEFVYRQKLGMVTGADGGYQLASKPDTVRAPDVGFIEKSRHVSERGFMQGAPDLAVEVLSPNDLYSEIMEKIGEYLNAGTRVVIVVDPRKQLAWIETLKGRRQLTIDDSIDAGDVLPGWSLSLRDLFES